MRREIFRRVPHLIRGWEAVADVVWPRECPLGESPPAESRGFEFLSAETVAKLPLVERGPWCETCGHPFFGAAGPGVRCVHCEGLGPVYESGRTVMLAKGAGRALLHEFKYRGGAYLAGDLARLAAQAPGYLERLEGAVLVPVPMFFAKEADRGFNPCAVYAEALARRVPGAECRAALAKVRETGSQTRLDRAARRANLRGAFAATREAGREPGRLHVVVDDVFTTGATLNAAAEALRAAGVTRVAVATLAHG